METFSENNNVKLGGIVASELELSHEIYGESFYSFVLRVMRLSEEGKVVAFTRTEHDENEETEHRTAARERGAARGGGEEARAGRTQPAGAVRHVHGHRLDGERARERVGGVRRQPAAGQREEGGVRRFRPHGL